jgi:hypothetical protein
MSPARTHQLDPGRRTVAREGVESRRSRRDRREATRAMTAGADRQLLSRVPLVFAQVVVPVATPPELAAAHV